MKKFVDFLLIILTVLIELILLVVVCFSVGEHAINASFYMNAEHEFSLPGAWDGVVHQGLDYVDTITLTKDGKNITVEDKYLVSGYMTNKKASRIYIVDPKTDTNSYVELFDTEGNAFKGHCGGIAYYQTLKGTYLYITGSNCLYVFDLADIFDGDSKATQLGKIELANVSPAFVEIKDGVMYCGSYYYPKAYETPETERITTPAGDKNTSIMLTYKMDLTGLVGNYGVINVPVTAYSTPGMVQGMCFVGSKMVLSTSWGLSNSKLLVYDMEKVKASKSETNYTAISPLTPLYYVDSASLVEEIQAPPMSEELVYHNGKIVIGNESASMKYIFGKITSGNYVWGLKYE